MEGCMADENFSEPRVPENGVPTHKLTGFSAQRKHEKLSKGINEQKTKKKGNMKVVTVWIPRTEVEKLDELVKRGFYPSRNEAIRFAVHDLLRAEYERRRLSL